MGSLGSSAGLLTTGARFSLNNTTAPSETKVFNLFSCKGRTAIVTGAGAGIGFAVAEALAEAGANVAIWYNSNKKAIQRAEAIEKEYGVKCKAYSVDVGDPNKVKESVEEIVKEFNGRLDIFVANAGIPWTEGNSLDGSLDTYSKVMRTDLDSTFYCARAAGLIWRRQKTEGTDAFGQPLTDFKAGSFIATASMSGSVVNIPQLQAPYNAAKAGIIHLVKSLAVEFVQFARANCVSPGYIATEITDFAPEEMKDIWRSFTPMGREGVAHELKGVFVYLASDASSFSTGADLIVDGGYSLP